MINRKKSLFFISSWIVVLFIILTFQMKVRAASGCLDSDSEWRPPVTSGTCTDADGSYSDSCSNAYKVTEYYCQDGIDYCLSETTNCTNFGSDYRCVDGRCVSASQQCTDTDNGQPQVRGTCSDLWGTNIDDTCEYQGFSQEGYVYEFTCKWTGGDQGRDYYKCDTSIDGAKEACRPRWDICQNGACITSQGPTISSVNFPVVTEGEVATFSVDWDDADGEGIKMYICKTSSILPGSGCADETWCTNSDNWDYNDPITCDYLTTLAGNYNAYAFVCDRNGDCSSPAQSALSVLTSHVPPTVSSFTDSPDPVKRGEAIEFSVNWDDADGDPARLYVCPHNDFAGSTCGGGGGSIIDPFCTTTSFEHTNPLRCSYTPDIGGYGAFYNYYVFICDSYPCSNPPCLHCSAARDNQGSFIVTGGISTTSPSSQLVVQYPGGQELADVNETKSITITQGDQVSFSGMVWDCDGIADIQNKEHNIGGSSSGTFFLGTDTEDILQCSSGERSFFGTQNTETFSAVGIFERYVWVRDQSLGESRSTIQISVESSAPVSGVYWSFKTVGGTDFSLSAAGPIYTWTTNQPNSTKTIINAVAQRGFREDINLTVADDGGLGGCVGWTFDPSPINPQGGSADSSLWIKTTNCSVGSYTITVKGTSASIPDPGRTATFDLSIASPPSGSTRAEPTTRPPFWRSILPW